MNPFLYVKALIYLFFAITFLQSSIDKLLNTKGNLDWFKSQFEKTILSPIITPSFWLIAIQELILAGWMIYAIYQSFVGCCQSNSSIWGAVFALFVLIQLFAGQRLAKDYVGASGIIPYIIVSILAALLESSFCTC